MAKLFRDIAEFRKYVGVNANMAFDLVEPFLANAEIIHIRPLLGDELYDEISVAYLNDTINAESPEKTLLEHIQRTLANYAMYEGLPVLLTQLSNIGVKEVQSKDGSTAPVRQWVFEQQREQFINAADAAAEEMLRYLDSNRGDFETWTESAVFAAQHELVIRSAKELAQYVSTNGSRRIYLAILPFIRLAQEEYLLPLLGQALYDDIIDKIKAGTEDTFEKMDILRRGVANMAIAKSMPQLAISLRGNGLFISGRQDMYSGNTSTTTQEVRALGAFKESCESSAMAAFRTLKQWLDENYSDNELYQDMIQNKNPRYTLPKNGCSSSSFIV
jgi:hypothetical protein